MREVGFVACTSVVGVCAPKVAKIWAERLAIGNRQYTLTFNRIHLQREPNESESELYNEIKAMWRVCKEKSFTQF